LLRRRPETERLRAQVRDLEAERDRLRDAIARFGEALAATLDREQLERAIVETAVEAIGAAGGMFVPPKGPVVRSGDLQGPDRLQLPLTAGREMFGILVLAAPQFEPEERLTAASFAAHAVVALENERLHRIVERQALVDGLTGLANRRQGEETLSAEVSRANRFESPLAVVLCDLDDFKQLNDKHGHPAGDAVLREFAALLAVTMREADLAARWGGEEFLLVLTGTDAPGGLLLAERIRALLEERAILTPDGAAVSVTASFGVAGHVAGASENELVAAADAALYKAKRSGKNCVEAAPVAFGAA
jgi:diguanylate cyclase (GGDEF)-like protein